MASKVTLRKKQITKGRYSLYLDFWPPIPHPDTGEPTRRKFLGLYVFIERREIRKKIEINEKMGNDVSKLKSLYKELKSLTLYRQRHNSETLKIAESLRLKYEKEQLSLVEIRERNFLEYFNTLAAKKKGANSNSWLSAQKYLNSFFKGSLKFGELEKSRIDDFRDYLLEVKSNRSNKAVLSRNTAAAYFNKFKAALRQAYNDGLLQEDVNKEIEPIKEAETRREYLTLEELNMLVQTHCNIDLLKRAALFSAFTGLRFSDIQNLEWGMLEFTESQGYSLKITQEKAEGVEYHPISNQAVRLMGDPGEPSGRVFLGLKYSAFSNKHLAQWIGAAGITRDITFHCFRHTYATQLLFNGTDIYTVSKMLGHKDLKTTQIYAKIVDQAKRKAANNIDKESDGI